MKEFFDVQSPVFRPLWRRIALVAVCLIWAVVELSLGALFWALLFGAAGVYLAHQFFVAFDPDKERDRE